MSAKQFPPQPNLKNLKNQAKQLLKAHQASQTDACKRIGESLPRLTTSSATEILDAEFSLQDAQLVIAREYGFASWPKLVAAVAAPESRDAAQRIELIDLDVLPEREHLQDALRHETFEQAEAAIKRLCAQPGISFRAVRWKQGISADVPLQPGDHVSPTEDRTGLLVGHYGYLNRQGNQIHVVLPLWVDGEGMAAYFLNLPQKEAPQLPDLEKMQDLLRWHGIKYGFSEEGLHQVVVGLRQGRFRDPLVRVAEGTVPQAGGDADFEWAVEIKAEQPGGGIPNSGFTFREGDGVTLVEKEDLVGRLLPPTAGQLGKDVFGHEIKAPDPINVEVLTNARIYVEEDEDGLMAFYAASEGGIYITSQISKIKDEVNRRINIGIYPVADEVEPSLSSA